MVIAALINESKQKNTNAKLISINANDIPNRFCRQDGKR